MKLRDAVSPAQRMLQVAPVSQLTEQEERQVTWQLEPSWQDTDPLCPTAMLHTALFSQVTLPLAPVLTEHID